VYLAHVTPKTRTYLSNLELHCIAVCSLPTPCDILLLPLPFLEVGSLEVEKEIIRITSFAHECKSTSKNMRDTPWSTMMNLKVRFASGDSTKCAEL
jgi:hypothetical protein